MRPNLKFWIILTAVELAVFSIIIGSCALAWVQLSPREQDFFSRVAVRVVPYPLLGALILFLIIALLVHFLFRHYVIPILKIGEETKLISAVNPGYRIEPKGPLELIHLADTINESADAFQALQQEIKGKIDKARADLRAERNRLAALMSKLPTGVLVCNTSGQVMLYNPQAQRLLQQPGKRIGLGRSIFGILDREAIVHALDLLHQADLQGEKAPAVNFITTAQENLCLRINMVPVYQEDSRPREISGFFLAIENITDQMEAELQRDQIFQIFTEDMRHFSDRIHGITSKKDKTSGNQEAWKGIDDLCRAMKLRVRNAREEYARHLFSTGGIETVLGDYLVEIIRRQLGRQAGIPVERQVAPEIWLQIDSYAMVQGLAHLGAPLRGCSDLDRLMLRLQGTNDRQAVLEIEWKGCALSREELDSWRHQPLIRNGRSKLISFSDLIDKVQGNITFLPPDRETCQGVRLTLPLSRSGEHFKEKVPAEDRPVYYEFNLLTQVCVEDLCKQPLNQLTFAVFDTETTGLQPSQGDEIIQVGAVRIVNGRILYDETMDQLVNPMRTVPEESIRIHGITPELLQDQPTIETVLPELHHFAEGSVLVAHNAAFDMKFLKLKERETGIRFEQPVLDTLLLSSIVHPHLEGHGLEQIAQRLNVAVIGRHTALGDALVTAEILCKLIPLLADKGIYTLNQALEACALSPYARLRF
ncbi:MAG: exonuclease domain-containing protein [Syntrophotaleaceae bacterium]